MLPILQGLKKEPEFEGYIALAQWFNGGWLPVQQLAAARPILQWARQQAPEALNSPEELLSAIQSRLESEKMTLAGTSLARPGCKQLFSTMPGAGS